MFDLSTDRQKVLFGLGVVFMLGTMLLFLYIIVSCLRRIGNFCKRNCGGYKLAATESDRVTPMEWELQELNYVYKKSILLEYINIILTHWFWLL